MHLMINAVQVMPDGGNLKIVTSDSDKIDMEVDEKTRSLFTGHRAMTGKLSLTAK